MLHTITAAEAAADEVDSFVGDAHMNDDKQPLPGMEPVHTSGYAQTVPANVVPPSVPAGGLDLEDDTPLPGGACNLDGSCESCQ